MLSSVSRRGLDSFARTEDLTARGCKSEGRWSKRSLKYQCPLFARKFRNSTAAAVHEVLIDCEVIIRRVQGVGHIRALSIGVSRSQSLLVSCGSCTSAPFLFFWQSSIVRQRRAKLEHNVTMGEGVTHEGGFLALTSGLLIQATWFTVTVTISPGHVCDPVWVGISTYRSISVQY